MYSLTKIKHQASVSLTRQVALLGHQERKTAARRLCNRSRMAAIYVKLDDHRLISSKESVKK
ncbi:hypothetical protein BpHYR1_027744 [Brachionus plicatilis]|uniref:Uncharacterized protein n=1 Tax=Brachionus plicatilis TaxID=10195 RepID=A0A3M7REA6_BRAPC|nr:hypothetical protein BpHYR1_027744 [Brachionus plicatilis]